MVKDALHSVAVVCVAVIRAKECLFFSTFPQSSKAIRRSQCAIRKNSVKVTRAYFQVKGLRTVTITLVLLFKAYFLLSLFSSNPFLIRRIRLGDRHLPKLSSK